jgi:regulator of CtrA degradation
MGEPQGATVTSIGSAFLKSKVFDILFSEAMALVEDTAAYLDGDGRTDSKALPIVLAIAYRSQSLRLTTRLVYVSSWVLLLRALREGELTEQQFKTNKGLSSTRATLKRRFDASTEGLPEKLRGLIARSEAVAEQILRFDAMIEPSKARGEAPAEGTLKPLALVREKRGE